MKKVLPSAMLYLMLGMAILGWWAWAFKQPVKKDSVETQEFLEACKVKSKPSLINACISPLKREILHEALSGDFSLMTKLMADWEVDAQIMEAHGLIGVKRLPRHAFTRAQYLGRLLKNSSPGQLQELRESFMTAPIYDDLGFAFDPKCYLQKCLPQTYVSATFLLALTDPSRIIALPKGMRAQSQLYPSSKTAQIPMDMDTRISERLYMAKPQIAFVSHANSHPSTIQALKNQGVALFTLKSIDNLEDINSALVRIGGVIGRSIEAELMSLFMESAMLSIDNRLLAQNIYHAKSQDKPQILFLNYHTQFTLPGKRTLTTQLLERIGISQKSIHNNGGSKFEWLVPLELEDIVNYNPECLVIISPYGKSLNNAIKDNPALQEVSAVQKKNVHFLEEQVQRSTTQYIVLAYYDIYNIIQDQ